MTKPIVIIESPYAGFVSRNLQYARAAVRDSIFRDEVPFASHLLYTQAGILDDNDELERDLGINLGYAFWPLAEKIVFYTDLGWSFGMGLAKGRCYQLGIELEERSIAAWASLNLAAR